MFNTSRLRRSIAILAAFTLLVTAAAMADPANSQIPAGYAGWAAETDYVVSTTSDTINDR
ncbi:MAG: hypothetical protein OXS29_03425 [bacterium]|nr:hypothetical protein [bacterium]MDE0288204.1 hypothetical protein [bacterium]MDE0437431.1 hypothetical protein [bacterium]